MSAATRVIVVTADQRGSTKPAATDLVPATLARLSEIAGDSMLRGFERTAGDEFQGILGDPAGLSVVLEELLREDTWNIGIGIGPADTPLPESTRAGRGRVFLDAREAVTAAKSAPWHLSVQADTDRSRLLETAAWLWAAVLGRRTPGGWEVADLTDSGHRYDDIAERLGISQSAVSQRARAAGIVEGRRARGLIGALAQQLLDPQEQT